MPPALPRTSPDARPAPRYLSSGPKWLRGVGRWLGRATNLSILDQGIVSAASFLTTLLVGRIAGAEQLGIYALASTIAVMAAAIQTALVSIPYTIYSHRLTPRGQRVAAGSSLVFCAAAAVLMAAGLLAASLLAVGLGDRSPLTAVLLTLAAAMPCLLLREFVRRYVFAHLRIGLALLLDAGVVALQVGGLFLLVAGGWLSAVTAYVVLAIASGTVAAAGLLKLRRHFRLQRARLLPELCRNWRLGRWVVASHAAAMFQTYAVHWLLALLLGAASTGVFAACMTLLLLANPLMIGIGNVLEAKAAHAWAKHGRPGLRRVVWSTTALVGGALAVYCLTIMVVGGPLVAWLYDGPQYEGQAATVAVLALSALVGSLDLGAAHGLRVLERADLSFRASVLSLLVTLIGGATLIGSMGTLGGALAVCAGNIAGAVARCGTFAWLSRDQLADH